MYSMIQTFINLVEISMQRPIQIVGRGYCAGSFSSSNLVKFLMGLIG